MDFYVYVINIDTKPTLLATFRRGEDARTYATSEAIAYAQNPSATLIVTRGELLDVYRQQLHSTTQAS